MRYSDNAKTVSTVAITNADIAGSVFDVSQDFLYAIQAVWTDSGSLSGTIKLQTSIDGTNWSDVTSSSQAVSGSNSFMWNIANVGYPKIRTFFTYTAGAGTLKVMSSNKGP